VGERTGFVDEMSGRRNTPKITERDGNTWWALKVKKVCTKERKKPVGMRDTVERKAQQ